MELLLVHGHGKVSGSCPLRDGDEEVNVFECLIPFIGESSLFSSCCLVWSHGETTFFCAGSCLFFRGGFCGRHYGGDDD